jgi:hypothetical protein
MSLSDHKRRAAIKDAASAIRSHVHDVHQVRDRSIHYCSVQQLTPLVLRLYDTGLELREEDDDLTISQTIRRYDADVGLTVDDTITAVQMNDHEWLAIDVISTTEIPPSVTGLPVGAPIAWLTSTAPAGFVMMDGSAIDADEHPKLAAVYGSNLPDLRDKFLLGAGTLAALNATGGAATASLVAANNGPHTHSVPINVVGGASGSLPSLWPNSDGGGGVQSYGTTSSGSGTPFSILNPYRAVNWICAAG